MTKFQILAALTDDNEEKTGAWRQWSTEEAHSAEAAIRAAYLKRPDANVLALVAVPKRSWKPTPVRTETVQKVVLGDVTPANSLEGAGVSPSEEA